MKKIVMATMLGFAASVSYAQDYDFAVTPNSIYGSVRFTHIDVDQNAAGLSGDTTPKAIVLGVGYKFSDYFAVEGNLGFGLDEDKVKDATWDFELDNMYGLSAIGYLPLNEVMRFYAKAGYVQMNYDDSDGDESDQTGFMYGAGIEVGLTSSVGMNIEYVNLPDGEYDDYDIDLEGGMASIGLFVQF